MVPGEIFHCALSRCAPHARDNLRMAIQMLDRGRDGIDISRLNDNSFHAVAYHIPRFAGRDHGQAGGGRFVNRFGAAFQPRWKNVNRTLTEIILEIAFETDNANILAPELLQIWFRFVMDAAEQPKFAVAQIQSVPGFEQMMNPFALDQRARENCAENCRPPSRYESLHVTPARQVE